MHNYNNNSNNNYSNYNMNYSSRSSSSNNNNDADIEQNTQQQHQQQQQQQKEQQLEMQQPRTADRTRTGTTSTAGTNTAGKGNGDGDGNGNRNNSTAAAATSVSATASASMLTSTSKTRARAMSLIYLPPFCSPCGHVVPAASNSSSTRCRSRSRSASRGRSRSRSPSRSHSRSPSSCCCCWTHKDYDKHARSTEEKATTLSKFLQRDIQLPQGHGMHIDLRQASQLVTPIAEGGHQADTAGEVEVLRRQRRERMRRQRPSHAASAAREIHTDDDGANEQVRDDDDDNNNDDDDDGVGDDDDECRCFNYNGDISALELQLEEREWYQLPSITWLKFTWQQLLCNATTETTKMTTTKTTAATATGLDADSRRTISSGSGNGSGSWGRLGSSSASAMTATKSCWAPLMLTLLLATSVSGWSARQDASTNCTFPARWEGSWFLSGYQQSIHIKGSQFSYRGRCAASDGKKYLMVDEKGCHRCLVIYEKHKNVLQYKESECEGDSMYMHQSNPSALAMRSSIKQSDHRGGAHPNTNGHSRLSSSDQYIMRSNDDMNDYFCKGRETLQNLCDQIPGDALLFSLFRESAEPVKCPIKGPFVFTYNRGNGECKSPVSNIESCTEESRLLLSFQACPDVLGTESTVEELTCLATWKDGNSRYLVGLVSHHHAISNEERFRCFVYEKISSLMGSPAMLSSTDAEYKLSQSGDATCNGLDSADVGSRIMLLSKPPAAERCDFPAWFKGPRHWHALMGNAVYNYHSNDGSVHIIKPNGYMETRALCEQINKQTATEMMAVVHYTTGCQSGFMCMMFYRRDTHVIEIQTGKPAIRLEDACAPDHFDFNKMAYITLLASNPEPHICPMEGLYNLRGAIGPPYLATRHKRNHNGKSHLGHGHHHHESSDSGDFSHKGHSSLSFRNAERMERGSWHANTRGLPVRSRRNAPQQQQQQQQQQHHQEKEQQQQALVLNSNSNDTSVGFIAARNRRDVPSCVTNYNAQRQLWIGCSAPNAIDVSPLCSVDGEEEYSCHGSWNENSTVFIIARHKGTKHGVCITYRPTEGNAAKLVVGDACYRGTQKPPDHHLVANLSVFGKCGETGSSASTNNLVNLLLLLLATLTWLTLQS